MFGVDDAIIGAVGGALVSGLFNSSSAAANRSFQAQQSSTSYQRAVADMKAAGLNPMLAYGNGGASTPSGAVAAPIQTGDFGVSSAAENKVKAEQQQLLEAQVEKVRAETRGIDTDNNIKMLYGDQQAKQTLLNSAASGDETISRIDLNRAQRDSVIKGIDKIIQDIQTSQSTAQSNYAYVEQLKQLTRNLKLDASEKEAMAKMWDSLGSSGAAAKTFVPFLQLVKSIFK